MGTVALDHVGFLFSDQGSNPYRRVNSLPLDDEEEVPAHGLFNVILQVRKLRIREGKCPAQGHTAGRCQELIQSHVV